MAYFIVSCINGDYVALFNAKLTIENKNRLDFYSNDTKNNLLYSVNEDNIEWLKQYISLDDLKIELDTCKGNIFVYGKGD